MCGLNGHRQFVFDVFDGSLVVIPIVEAQRLASLNDALEDSSTWREFQSCVANDAETISYLEGQYGDELPSPDDPFAPEDIPGFVEGAFPAWPQQLMLRWLPASVQALGTVRESLLNGSFLHIDEDRSDEAIIAMHENRIECVGDAQGLVVRACGAWRYW